MPSRVTWFQMNIRGHVFVSGQVQGVFFRSQTENLASDRGVTGWIGNLPDGRVEAVFEGEQTNVNELIKFCRRGPPNAKVTDVKVSYEQYKGEFSSFRVLGDHFL